MPKGGWSSIFRESSESGMASNEGLPGLLLSVEVQSMGPTPCSGGSQT